MSPRPCMFTLVPNQSISLQCKCFQQSPIPISFSTFQIGRTFWFLLIHIPALDAKTMMHPQDPGEQRHPKDMMLVSHVGFLLLGVFPICLIWRETMIISPEFIAAKIPTVIFVMRCAAFKVVCWVKIKLLKPKKWPGNLQEMMCKSCFHSLETSRDNTKTYFYSHCLLIAAQLC